MTGYTIGSDEEACWYYREQRCCEDEELYFRSQCEAEGEKAWPTAAPANTTHKDNSMNVNEAFPSKYLKSADLRGNSVLVKISIVTQEEVGQSKDVKLVMYFAGKAKGMVLNKTNANVIASKHGDDTDGWGGAEIEIYPDRVSFNNQMVDALRVRLPVPRANGDDEIPF